MPLYCPLNKPNVIYLCFSITKIILVLNNRSLCLLSDSFSVKIKENTIYSPLLAAIVVLIFSTNHVAAFIWRFGSPGHSAVRYTPVQTRTPAYHTSTLTQNFSHSFLNLFSADGRDRAYIHASYFLFILKTLVTCSAQDTACIVSHPSQYFEVFIFLLQRKLFPQTKTTTMFQSIKQCTQGNIKLFLRHQHGGHSLTHDTTPWPRPRQRPGLFLHRTSCHRCYTSHTSSHTAGVGVALPAATPAPRTEKNVASSPETSVPKVFPAHGSKCSVGRKHLLTITNLFRVICIHFHGSVS